MTDKRKGDWIQTYTGKKFYPLDPRPEDVNIEDIAHSLSLQCRFMGHCDHFYSVAQHSINVAEFVARCYHKNDIFWQEHLLDYAEEKISYDDMVCHALLHDASESYLMDVPRPIKPHLINYKEIEEKVMDVISERFELPKLGPEHKSFLKSVDYLMMMVEHKELGMADKAPNKWVCPKFLENKWPTIKLILNDSWEKDKLEFMFFFETLGVRDLEKNNGQSHP